ncbi:MAG: hypothetical protein AAF420_01670, partial [Pseudomonadota bacterium]
MDEENYNFYELLDLSPTLDPKSDRDELRQAITTKQRQLGVRKPPAQQAAAKFAQRKAKLMLQLLDGGAKDDLALLRKHKQKRADDLLAASTKDQGLYRDFLEIYGKKRISNNVASALLDSSEAKASIQPVLDDMGVKLVEESAKPTASNKFLLPTYVLTELDTVLSALGHDDYYDYLSDDSTERYSNATTITDLERRVKALQAKLNANRVKDDALHTTALTHGLTIFKSKANKAEFDSWVALKPFNH